MEKIILKPAPGVVVRCPVTKTVLKDGQSKPLSRFWLRRIAEGSVVKVVAKQAPRIAAKPDNKGGE